MENGENAKIISELRDVAQNLSLAVTRLQKCLNKLEAHKTPNNLSNPIQSNQFRSNSNSVNSTVEQEEDIEIRSHRSSLVQDIKKKFEFVRTASYAEKSMRTETEERNHLVNVRNLKKQFETENDTKIKEEQSRKSEEVRKSVDMNNPEDEKVKRILKYFQSKK